MYYSEAPASHSQLDSILFTLAFNLRCRRNVTAVVSKVVLAFQDHKTWRLSFL